MSTSVVYMIVNGSNGHRYIGATSQVFHRRWSDHKSSARRNLKYPLHRAIRKYGPEVFFHTMLGLYASIKEAIRAEVSFIAQFKPEYNITSGGEGVSFPRTPEQRAKMSAIKKANPSRPMLGRSPSLATREKMAATKRGRPRGPMPAEALAIFAENMRRSAKSRRKPVICLTTGHRFESLTNAAIAVGLGKSALAHVCSGKRTSIYGLVFRYEDAA